MNIMGKKVFFVCRRYCPGEAWTNRVLGYVKGLSELGVIVTLVYLISDKRRNRYNIDIPNVHVINLWEQDGFLAKKIRHFSFVINLLKARRLIQGDDIFIYGGEEFILKTFLQLKNRGKVLTEITENPFVGCNNIVQKWNVRRKLRAIMKSDKIFVISKNLKHFFIEQGYLESDISVINMFVDDSRFANVSKEVDFKYIAYCGVVSYNKDGVDILIRAFARFHKECSQYKLLIIGRGENGEIIKQLSDLARREQVEDYVVFTGAIEPSMMPKYLVNADILALARPDNLQAQHGFPTKLGEYLATGNPVVVTAVGEIPNFIKHKDNGLLAIPNNVEDFADKLIWVAKNPHWAAKIGENGKKMVKKEFSYLCQSKILFNSISCS